MNDRPRLVVDNNVLISRLLLPASVPAQAVRKAVDTGQLLVSDATMQELATVLARRKLDAYISVEDRQEFLRLLGRLAKRVPASYVVHACRDPKDNIILEAAVNGHADLIITGDSDLLALEIFHEIPIVTPPVYLSRA